MHIEPRLLVFTKGVRARIAGAVAIGLLAIGLGIARLALLGWLIGRVFAGAPLGEIAWAAAAIAVVMVLRGAAEHWRAVTAHETAARVQKKLRRIVYDKIASLGPGTVGLQRSGGLTLSLIATVVVLPALLEGAAPAAPVGDEPLAARRRGSAAVQGPG